MHLSTNNLPGEAVPLPQLALAALAANWVVAAGQRHPPLHLDCSAPPCQHTLGVCHQVSQLLLLRRAGVEVWLYQVNPVLGRCLQALQVAHLFTWAA